MAANDIQACKEIFDHYAKEYHELKNVVLTFEEKVVVNDVEAAGATFYNDNNLPLEIRISTHVYRRVLRSKYNMIHILLHEISHAVTDHSALENNAQIHGEPSYGDNSKSLNNKTLRKRDAQRKFIDSHHPPMFWDKYVEVMKYASKRNFINVELSKIDVNYVKKLNSCH